MPEVTLFCEDSFHEKFVGALLVRFAKDCHVDVRTKFYSARGGLPRMHGELKEFLRDLSRERGSLPDHLIVVVDATATAIPSAGI
ncbi:MAG TPA: hypothetical protein VFA33_10305 [Bryobacteraceae bacterium]|nr:hypothetical protein [Bryobacteraceae bacterium]